MHSAEVIASHSSHAEQYAQSKTHFVLSPKPSLMTDLISNLTISVFSRNRYNLQTSIVKDSPAAEAEDSAMPMMRPCSPAETSDELMFSDAAPDSTVT